MADSAHKVSRHNSKLLFIILGVVVLAGIAVAAYFYMQYQKTHADSTLSAQQEGDALVAKVGKLMVLPQNEQPTIATVSDVNKLKGQSFFADAKDGDKVLMYANAKKAILYDPTENKIVNLGPININQTNQSAPAAATTTTPASIKVAIYNGTDISGYSAKVAEELKTSLPQFIITEKTNAQKNTYTKTDIIDISGKQAPQAAILAKQLHGEVASLPEGENKPQDADILIILGSNQ